MTDQIVVFIFFFVLFYLLLLIAVRLERVIKLLTEIKEMVSLKKLREERE